MEVLESTPCRDQQRLLLAAEAPDLAKPVAAEAAAFAGAVDALGRHKLGLNETEAAVKSLGLLAESATKNWGGKMEMVAGVWSIYNFFMFFFESPGLEGDAKVAARCREN